MARARGQTLGEILKEATAEHGLLGAYPMKDVAITVGYSAPQALYHLMDDKMRTLPRPANLIGLAKVLRLPVAEVLIAAGRSTGMRIGPMPKLAFQLPPKVDNLGENEQAVLAGLIDEFCRERLSRRRR